MQQQRVLSWLSQHNFPHGLVSFADGLSTDFLAHKITYLKSLVQVNISHNIVKYVLPTTLIYFSHVNFFSGS